MKEQIEMRPAGETPHYAAIDALRVFAAVGIVLMHVQGNGTFRLDGFVFEKLIPSFTDLVFLFMVISGFSMCCGYYDKIVNGTITVEAFYSKRFEKVWPFFALLCLLEFAVSPGKESLYEVIADLTLCFGLIPDANISVVGVGWFLGLIFVFYFMFPFFCYLLSDRKRAWLSAAGALALNYVCTVHFDVERTYLAFSAMFFVAGGLIFLYRQTLSEFAKRYGILLLTGIAAMLLLYYTVSDSAFVMLILFSLVLIYAIRTPGTKSRVLCNPVIKMLSGLSMEIYLSHMAVFRVLEKLGVHRLIASDVWSYIITALATLLGAVAFSAVTKALLQRLCKRIKEK